MTALAVTGMIAAIGAVAVGNAALTFLSWVATGLGALVMLMLALFAVAYLLTWRDARKHPLTLVLAPPVPRPECPWCHTHECIDSTLCNCGDPCGSWLCTVKEASRG